MGAHRLAIPDLDSGLVYKLLIHSIQNDPLLSNRQRTEMVFSVRRILEVKVR
jgi:hypothetical protein